MDVENNVIVFLYALFQTISTLPTKNLMMLTRLCISLSPKNSEGDGSDYLSIKQLVGTNEWIN